MNWRIEIDDTKIGNKKCVIIVKLMEVKQHFLQVTLKDIVA